jgi:hypothetical protein
VVRLISNNEKHSYQDDDSMVLISFDEGEDDEEPRAKPHGCINT